MACKAQLLSCCMRFINLTRKSDGKDMLSLSCFQSSWSFWEGSKEMNAQNRQMNVAVTCRKQADECSSHMPPKICRGTQYAQHASQQVWASRASFDNPPEPSKLHHGQTQQGTCSIVAACFSISLNTCTPVPLVRMSCSILGSCIQPQQVFEIVRAALQPCA